MKTYSAVRWTGFASSARMVLQLAQVAILARLLSPDDYGLLAMVSVILSFASLFADFGINSAYVQRQDVSVEQRSSLFWFNVLFSTAISFIVAACSPLVAWFYHDQRLTPLVAISSSTFVLSALGQQIRMNSEKELDFRPIVGLEIGAATLGFATAVVTAFLGWGVFALVASSVMTALSGSMLAWAFVAKGWRPLWRLKKEDISPFLGFGGALVINNIINQINMTVDLFLGGVLLPANQLGLYSVPRNLVLQLQYMVNPIITRVGFPLIAQVQKDTDRVRSIYLKTLNMIASTNAPLYICLMFYAPEITNILLGAKWAASAPLLRLMAAWGLLRSTVNPVGSLLLGMGRADLSMKWNIALVFVVPPLLWIGSHYGATGLAWALIAAITVVYLPVWYILVRPLCQAGLFDYLSSIIRPCLIALCSLVPGYLLTSHLHLPLFRLGIAALISIPLYLALSYFGNRAWFAAMLELMGRRGMASQGVA